MDSNHENLAPSQPARSLFSAQEQARYQRHFQLPAFSAAGQAALKQARVLVVGVGGLGCPAAQYLAAAGVGNITLLDGDTISLSNLQRQILFQSDEVGQPKASVAATRLRQLNGDIAITAITEALSLDNAQSLIANHELIIDCTDNFHSRYLINDICTLLAKPWLYGSVLAFSGQLALFVPGQACFRCLFPVLSEVADCNQAGVLGVVPGLLGVLQASEAIKYLAGLEGSLANQLLSVDGLQLAFKRLLLQRDEHCEICSGNKTFRDKVADYQPVSALAEDKLALPAEQLTAFIRRHNARLIDVRSAVEHQQANLGGELLPAEAIKHQRHALDPKQWYVLYCQTGTRSRRAVQDLIEQGFSKVRSLAGGVASGVNTGD